jgi:hypothetical protein
MAQWPSQVDASIAVFCLTRIMSRIYVDIHRGDRPIADLKTSIPTQLAFARAIRKYVGQGCGTRSGLGDDALQGLRPKAHRALLEDAPAARRVDTDMPPSIRPHVPTVHEDAHAELVSLLFSHGLFIFHRRDEYTVSSFRVPSTPWEKTNF